MKCFARRRLVRWSFSTSALLLLLGCGPSRELGESAPAATETARTRTLGPSLDAFEKVTRLRLGPGSRHELPTLGGAAVPLIVENYELEGGWLAMNGHAEGVPSARFILKGERGDLSGWLAFREQNLAYEYKTVDGALV